MQSLKVGEGQAQQTFICVHWRAFPPLGAGEDAETLRRAGTLNDETYNRLLLWQRDCGLLKMAESKCLGCPHRRKVVWKTQGPVLVDPRGVETPVVDMATGEASPRNRHMANIFQRPGTKGSLQAAAWVRAEGESEDTDKGDV